jgi:hypothetical protein
MFQLLRKFAIGSSVLLCFSLKASISSSVGAFTSIMLLYGRFRSSIWSRRVIFLSWAFWDSSASLSSLFFLSSSSVSSSSEDESDDDESDEDESDDEEEDDESDDDELPLELFLLPFRFFLLSFFFLFFVFSCRFFWLFCTHTKRQINTNEV